MTFKRFAAGLMGAFLLQGAFFAWYYRDLIALRQPVATLAAAERGAFETDARRVLGRRRLTRAHLETLSEAAKRLGLTAIEVRALERRAEEDPADRRVRFRLADALRRSGDFSRAEAIYLQLLASDSSEAR